MKHEGIWWVMKDRGRLIKSFGRKGDLNEKWQREREKWPQMEGFEGKDDDT